MRERGTQPKKPETSGGQTFRSDSVQIGRPFAREDVAKKMVVDNDRSHLRRGEVAVGEPSNQLSMILCAEGPREERLASCWGK
jgi:hypothetical protein